MSKPWFILNTRFGTDVRDPSLDLLNKAIQEVIDPKYDSDNEHTNAAVRYGHDEGPMYVLAYDKNRCLSFEQWADQDAADESVPTGYLYDVHPEEALRLMQELQVGEISRVRQQAWESVESN